MAHLSTDEKTFYKQLFQIVNDTHINELLVKYATLQYNIAIKRLKEATDPILIGRYQGEAAAWERLVNIRTTVTDVMRTGG